MKSHSAQQQAAPQSVQITVGQSVLVRAKSIYDDVARRAHELFEKRGRADGYAWVDWFRAEQELLEPLSLQVTEDNNEIKVRAEVPGFKREELKVNLGGSYLTISGEHEQHDHRKTAGGILTQQHCGCFVRTISLPAAVGADKAKATLKDGSLELSLPKLAA